MSDEKIEVSAYSGARDEEIPRSFILYGEKIVVEKILEMWIEEVVSGKGRKRFFKLRGSDGYTHKLYYDELRREWFISKAGGLKDQSRIL